MGSTAWAMILVPVVAGGAIGTVMAQQVAIPACRSQALLHSFVGLAAVLVDIVCAPPAGVRVRGCGGRALHRDLAGCGDWSHHLHRVGRGVAKLAARWVESHCFFLPGMA